MTEPIRIAQLSDTHFLEDGAAPEGGHAYDTDAAFEAVLSHLGDHAYLDLIAVTGDVADHGRAEQYRKATAAFSRLQAPVNACPGNHDFDAAFTANMGRTGVNTSRVVEIGNWAFLFVDSNAGVMQTDESGLPIDPPGEQRLHINGVLGRREAAWVRSMCAATTADHVFIWLHHPPEVPIPMCHDASYAAEWRALLGDLPIIKGLGGGHTHIPAEYELLGRPVFVAPSFKNNFALEEQTWLPPGYRTYEFDPDGSIRSEVLVDDEQWPRVPYGRALKSLFMGELTFQGTRRDFGSSGQPVALSPSNPSSWP
ncbi:MAG: metallophosphoesterase [Acidimicrobiales bacterium]